MWETLLPNLVHITGIPLSEILFIGDQAPRNNLEPESYTLSIIRRHPGTWVRIGRSDRSDHGPTVRPRSDPSDPPPLDRTIRPWSDRPTLVGPYNLGRTVRLSDLGLTVRPCSDFLALVQPSDLGPTVRLSDLRPTVRPQSDRPTSVQQSDLSPTVRPRSNSPTLVP